MQDSSLYVLQIIAKCKPRCREDVHRGANQGGKLVYLIHQHNNIICEIGHGSCLDHNIIN